MGAALVGVFAGAGIFFDAVFALAGAFARGLSVLRFMDSIVDEMNALAREGAGRNRSRSGILMTPERVRRRALVHAPK